MVVLTRRETMKYAVTLRMRSRTRLVAGVVGFALLASACGADSTGATGDDISLTDMPQVVLRVQSAHGPDAAPSRALDAWHEVVDVRSNGRIQFEMFQGGSLAPLPEIEEGLESGLLDIATHSPVYNPAQFPTENVIQAMNSTIDPTPLAGTLQAYGAQAEFALDDLYPAQFEENGMQPLLVPALVVPSYHLACAGEKVQSLDDAEGVRVRVPSEHLAGEVEALGMSPTSTSVDELYEALQRGVVDCVLATPFDIRDMGLTELIDYWVIDSEAMWSGVTSFHLSMSQAAWDDLPTEAQQLLWETAGTSFLPTILAESLSETADGINQAEQEGVEFHEWDEEVRTTLREYQEEALENAAAEMDNGQEFSDRFMELHEHWLEILPDLGYDSSIEVSYEDFPEAHQEETIDLEPFLDRVNEIRAEHSP